MKIASVSRNIDFNNALVGQIDIVGFNVPVGYPSFVHEFDTFTHLSEPVNDFSFWELLPSFSHKFVQTWAIDVFGYCDEAFSSGFVEIVDLNEVGMDKHLL